MFKKITIAVAIFLLVLSTAVAAKTPKGSFGVQAGAFVESNILANAVGTEAEGYYMFTDGFGAVLGVRGFGYFAFDDESKTGTTPIKPEIMPYAALKFNSFEIGGGAGFNLSDTNATNVTPYLRMNWDIPFSSAVEGNNNRFSMTVGTHWYIVMPIIENTDIETDGTVAGAIGAGFATGFLGIIEALGNMIIPKVSLGFTYQFDHIASANV